MILQRCGFIQGLFVCFSESGRIEDHRQKTAEPFAQQIANLKSKHFAKHFLLYFVKLSVGD